MPVLLATLADEAPTTAVSDMADPSDTAVKRFLKWIKDPIKETLALEAAMPRQLNKDIIKRLLPESEKNRATELFDWLQDRPFVQKKGDIWRYHPIVRELMLRYQKQVSEEDWEKAHTSLATFYQERIDKMGLANSILQFKNERCMGYLLENSYHHPIKQF